MSNELQYYGDPAVDAGLTVVARVYDSSGVQVGSDVATTEVGALAIYRGDMPVAVEGSYGVRFFSGTLLLGQETISWDGTAEKINASTSDVTANETKIDTAITQATLARKHLTNRDKIDTTANTLTRYDDDGTTPLVVFDLKDGDGDASSTQIYEKTPQ
jgi:hypothetical protein